MTDNIALDEKYASKITDTLFSIANTKLFIDFTDGAFSSYKQDKKDRENISKKIKSVYDNMMRVCIDTNFGKDNLCTPDRHKIASAIALSILNVRPFAVRESAQEAKTGMYFYTNELLAFLSGFVIVCQYSKKELNVPNKNYYEWICKALEDVHTHSDKHGVCALMLLSNVYYLLEFYTSN